MLASEFANSVMSVISCALSLADMWLYILHKQLMSGMSQHGMVATHKLGSDTVSAVFPEKSPKKQ